MGMDRDGDAPEPARIWSIDSTDPDETNELLGTFGGVRIRHHQIATRRYSAALKAVRLEGLQFATTSYGSGILSQGTPPPGAYALALPLTRPDGVFFNHEALDANAIGTVSPGQEFSLIRSPAFQCVTVFSAADRLDCLADAMFGRTLSEIGRRDSVVLAEARALRACSRHLAQLCKEAATTRATIEAWSGPPGGVEQLESELIDNVLGAIDPLEPVRGWSNQKRIVRRAWELVEDRGVIAVSELCTQLGVPLRSLDAAFRSCTGIKPRQFLSALRLNKVRRMLNRPNDDTTVTSAATRCDFFHFGRFTAAYLRLFGELPSNTLRRARR
jgi:AraC family ethanolamine operon transcriptional activator